MPMDYEIIFFDLDSTLYPEESGLWQAIGERIDLYLSYKMGWSAEIIPHLRHQLFMDYGTTLKGLQIKYDVDPFDYLEFVHDLPLEDYLKPDPSLREILLRIDTRRWVFTNADKPHSERILKTLEIQDCFEGIIDVWAMDPYVKPMKEAYEYAMEHTGISNPRKCVLIDDSSRNLDSAREMGFFTIFICENGTQKTTHRTIKTIHHLPELAGEINFSKR
jgi:putative hydrolase of the HAD superfamily